MKRIRMLLRYFKTLGISVIPLIASVNAYAGDKDCWADFFEESQYKGKHVLVSGPAQYENLNKLNGEDWNQRIHSIKVGPKARVTIFQNPKFELSLTEMAKKPDFLNAWGITEQDIKEDSELIFNENATIHDLGDFNFHKKVRSLKVECL